MTTIKINIVGGIPEIDTNTVPKGWTVVIRDLDENYFDPEEREIITTFEGTGPAIVDKSVNKREAALGHYRVQVAAISKTLPELTKFAETGKIDEPYAMLEEVRDVIKEFDALIADSNDEEEKDDLYDLQLEWHALADDLRDMYASEIEL